MRKIIIAVVSSVMLLIYFIGCCNVDNNTMSETIAEKRINIPEGEIFYDYDYSYHVLDRIITKDTITNTFKVYAYSSPNNSLILIYEIK